MVVVPEDVIERYDRFSLHNSPYPAHESGCAIDLYPGTDAALSPVSGTVRSTRTVRCPGKPYAAPRDHLILIDCGDHVARVLHVDPGVEAGDDVSIGDRLGTLVRSGFFGRWVDNHIHLGFRRPGQNLQRASGSVPIDVDVRVTGLGWDGWGQVVEAGPTHLLLDSPPTDGCSGFTALADDHGVPLDGGLIHYSGGGTFSPADGERSLLGTTVGIARGRRLTWGDVAVFANGQRATGLSLFASRAPFGTKVVFHTGHGFEIGDRIHITVEPTADPTRLG